MRRIVVGLLLIVAATTACRSPNREITVRLPKLSQADIAKTVLRSSDVGKDWVKQRNPQPNTVQIGGRIGAASIQNPLAEATSAFQRKDRSASVSNTVYLARTTALASAIIAAHEDAASRETWTQERDDGGSISFKSVGLVPGVAELGDAVFSENLTAKVRAPGAKAVKHTISYVAYRIGAVVAFVVAEDTGASKYARRQERRITRLLR